MKTIIMPVLDITTQAHYERSATGLWRNIHNNETWMYSLSEFFSNFGTLKQVETRVVGRGCNMEEGLTIVSGNTGNYLNEDLIVFAKRSFNVTESCKDDDGVVKRTWMINKTATFTLPITCALTSELLRCGYVQLVGTEDEEIVIQPSRMEFLEAGDDLCDAIADEEWFRDEPNFFKSFPWQFWLGVIGAAVAFTEILSSLIGFLCWKQKSAGVTQ